VTFWRSICMQPNHLWFCCVPRRPSQKLHRDQLGLKIVWIGYLRKG
jgi:hypothetical protein